MNIYKGIICKDIATVGDFNYAFWYIFLLFIAVFTACGILNMFTLWLFFCIVLEQGLNLLWNDDTQNWNKYSPALMIPRNKIVNEKYIQLVGKTAVGVLLIELSAVAGCLVRGEKLLSMGNLLIVSEAVSVMCVISVCMLFMFMGHKFLSIAFVAFSAGMMSGMTGGSVDARPGDFCGHFDLSLKELPAFMAEPTFHWIAIIVLPIVTCLIWRLTLELYKKKDL